MCPFFLGMVKMPHRMWYIDIADRPHTTINKKIHQQKQQYWSKRDPANRKPTAAVNRNNTTDTIQEFTSYNKQYSNKKVCVYR